MAKNIKIIGKAFDFSVKDKITLEKDGIRVTMRITGIDPNDFDFPVWAKVPNGKITMIARKRPASKGYEYFTDKAFHEYVKSIS